MGGIIQALHMDNLAVFFAILTIAFFLANSLFMFSAGFKKNISTQFLLSVVLTLVLTVLYSTKSVIFLVL